MALLLEVQSHPEVTSEVVRMCDGLVAGGDLNVGLTVESDVAVEAVHEAVDRSVVVADVLVHQTEVEVNGRDVWVVVTANNLEDVESFLDVFKGLGVILAGVVVQAEVGVAIRCCWGVVAQDLLLDDQALGLQLYCLQVVSEFELDVGHLRYAGGHVLMHWTIDLQQHIYGLTIEIESCLKMATSLCLSGLVHEHHSIPVRDVQMLQDWVEVADITRLERQVRIDEYLLIRQGLCLLGVLLGTFALSSFLLSLSRSLALYNSGDALLHQHGIVVENELLSCWEVDLDTCCLAEVSQQSELVLD